MSLLADGTLASAAFTGVMAFATWKLAKQTHLDVEQSRDLVSVTEEQLELSSRALRASRQPLLAPEGPGFIGSPNQAWGHQPGISGQVAVGNVPVVQRTERALVIAVPLRNIGAGPAVVQRAWWPRLEAEGLVLTVPPDLRAVAPEERYVQVFVCGKENEDFDAWCQRTETGRAPDFLVGRAIVPYTDAGGFRYETTIALGPRRPDGLELSWLGMSFEERGSDRPRAAASTGPGHKRQDRG